MGMFSVGRIHEGREVRETVAQKAERESREAENRADNRLLEAVARSMGPAVKNMLERAETSGPELQRKLESKTELRCACGEVAHTTEEWNIIDYHPVWSKQRGETVLHSWSCCKPA